MHVDIARLMQLIDRNFPFEKFREGQKLVIKRIVEAFLNDKKFFILESPTGSGKSVIGITAAKVINELLSSDTYGPPIIALTHTKVLQDQYEESIPDSKKLYGALNYACSDRPGGDTYYGSSLCKKQECGFYSECEYLFHKSAFIRSETGLLSYAYYIRTSEFYPNVLIHDECHSMEDLLCGFASVDVNLETIEDALNYLREHIHRIPDLPDNMIDDMNASGASLINLVKQFIKLQDNSPDFLVQLPILSKQIYKSAVEVIRFFLFYEKATNNESKYTGVLQNLSKKVTNLFALTTEWIVADQDEHSVCLKPIEVKSLAKPFFRRAKFNILMSATICGVEDFTSSLGIEKDEYEYLSMDSVFPVENRQFYSSSLPGINRENKDQVLPVYAEFISGILDQMPNERGIIHSVSYDNAETIFRLLSNRRVKLLLQGQVASLQGLLRSSNDTIVVSPSILEGIDLTGDLSRIQIFLKVPYEYLGDKWIARKAKISHSWYARRAVIKIIQGSGRSIRSKEDYAYTFMLDSNFNRLFTRYNYLFPEWFRKAVVKLDD